MGVLQVTAFRSSEKEKVSEYLGQMCNNAINKSAKTDYISSFGTAYFALMSPLQSCKFVTNANSFHKFKNWEIT